MPSLEINGKITESVEGLCGNFLSVLDGWDLCAWIGLNDYALEGHFIWDSTMVATPDFRNFLPGEPNNMGDEDGIALCWERGGRWIDFQNSGKLPSVCEDNG